MAIFEWDVLIPAYNAAETIEATIESALRQDHPPARVIVYDDASIDGTSGLAGNYSEVTLLRGETNKGVGVARQQLLHQSSSEWILILDADDVLIPEASEFLRRAVERSPNADLICFQEAGRDPDSTTIEHIQFRKLWWRNNIISSAALINRSSIIRAGGYSNRRRLVDYDAWLRMFSDESSVGWSYPNAIVIRLISADTITGNVIPAVIEQKRLIEQYKRSSALGILRHFWTVRILELWARGYMRHINYGKTYDTYLRIGDLGFKVLPSYTDRLLRNKLTSSLLMRRHAARLQEV